MNDDIKGLLDIMCMLEDRIIRLERELGIQYDFSENWCERLKKDE